LSTLHFRPDGKGTIPSNPRYCCSG